MINLSFPSDPSSITTFQVAKFDGEEQMSHLFRFKLVLVSQNPSIDFNLMLQSEVSLAIKTQGITRYVHGMFSQFEQGRKRKGGSSPLYEYRAVLVPRMWMLTQSLQNQIFAAQQQSVTDIIRGEIESFSAKGQHPQFMPGLEHEMNCSNETYENRDYVVQYSESDFNFISRLMEHEGIHYYFEHYDSKAKLVIGDGMLEEKVPLPETLPPRFANRSMARAFDKSVVYKLTRVQKQVPEMVSVSDYNDDTPSTDLKTDSDIVINGIGLVIDTADHYKEKDVEGHKRAKIRAEEFRCRQNIYSGKSNISSFCPGYLYQLKDHFNDDYNDRDYLLTRVKHKGSQDIESWGNVGGTSYQNDFTCIPADIQFRPQRLTPKPRLHGIMNGIIDSEQDINRADLDDKGRYKVRMIFDKSDNAAGQASHRIRMAQPYGPYGGDSSGEDSGMSFPLLPGTEVIWSCIDGDIDRPIITGAVANETNKSVTNTDNHTSNVIKTTSGITMGFHDGPGGTQAASGKNKRFSVEVPGHMLGDPNADPVPTDTGKTFMRLGAKPDTQYAASVSDEDLDRIASADLGGIYSYTDGTRTEITQGNVSRYHYAGVSDYYDAKQFSYAHDNQFGVFAGNKFDATIGLVGEYRIGGKCESTLGVDVSINSGLKFEFGMSFQYSATAGPDLTLADDIQQEANSSILLAVDPEDEDLDKWMEQSSPWIAAIGAGLSSIPFGIASHKEGHDTSNGLTEGFATTQYVGSAIAAAFATAHYATRKGDNPASFMKMDPNKIYIQVTGVENPTKLGMWRPPGMGTRDSINPDNPKSFDVDVFGKHGDKNPVSLEMKKEGAKGTLELTAGKSDKQGAADEPDSEIRLTVGRSSITIKDNGIEFNAPSYVFDVEGKTKVLVTDHTYIENGELKVIDGGISVKGDLIATGEVHTDTYTHHTGGDAAAAGPKPTAPKVSKQFGK